MRALLVEILGAPEHVEQTTIFLTTARDEHYPDFEHGRKRYVFDRLHPDRPLRLADGPVFIFIDWVLEAMSGLEMCRRLRGDARLADAHITMILDSDDETDRRRALKAGADDYIVGPVDRAAVLDRVLALETPAAQRAMHCIEDGDLRIDLASLQARVRGEPVPLQPNEFRLLRFFVENPDRVLSREDLIAGLGKREPPIDARTVDVWVGRLRRAMAKVGAAPRLRTVRSMGYVWDTD